MYKDYDNYRTYENDDLSAGATLKVEHTIIVNETDILNLISHPLEKGVVSLLSLRASVLPYAR